MNFAGRCLLIMGLCAVFGLFAGVADAQTTILEIVVDNTAAYAQPVVTSDLIEILKAGTKVVSPGKVSNFYEITTPSGAKGYIVDSTARVYQAAPPPAAAPVPAPVTAAPAAEPPPAPVKPKEGFTLGLVLEKQLFLLGGIIQESVDIDYDTDSYSFSGESDMEPTSAPGFGLEIGYTFKGGYILAQGNLNKEQIEGKLKWDDKDGDAKIESDDDYKITYQRIAFRGGFYLKEERGRPFIEGSLGFGTAEFEFTDYNDMSFDKANIIDIGFAGGYDYLIKDGFGVAAGGRLSVIGTTTPFKFSDSYDDEYGYTTDVKDEVQFTMVPLTLFVRMYYVF